MKYRKETYTDISSVDAVLNEECEEIDYVLMSSTQVALGLDDDEFYDWQLSVGDI